MKRQKTIDKLEAALNGKDIPLRIAEAQLDELGNKYDAAEQANNDLRQALTKAEERLQEAERASSSQPDQGAGRSGSVPAGRIGDSAKRLRAENKLCIMQAAVRTEQAAIAAVQGEIDSFRRDLRSTKDDVTTVQTAFMLLKAEDSKNQGGYEQKSRVIQDDIHGVGDKFRTMSEQHEVGMKELEKESEKEKERLIAQRNKEFQAKVKSTRVRC